ncbi:amidohydrolase [Yinghuangia seranimata]|uniref:amidohydrolase n=1 Tax=Yinghuangia seranimata TaxID=408067 RepID=UPI00248C702A|nr:amidohydrolase [Yinghuangia seranimata]MDI2126729.1 amidohydrolase [Yinghuangia seranimata]
MPHTPEPPSLSWLFQGLPGTSPIRTNSPEHGDTHALLVRDGRIVALGDDAVRLAEAEPPEQRVQVSGLLMPAFGDGHAHPMFAGLEWFGPRIRGAGSVEEIIAAVGAWATEHPGEDWIVGASYDPTLAPDGVFDAAWLDEVVADRPVVLRAGDYHTVWCNSEALRRAGVTADTPDPRLGWIVRRADGSPSGTLREWHACDLVLDRVPGRSVDELVEALGIAGARYAECGVTFVQDAWVEPDMVEPYLVAEERGRLSFRANLAFRADPDTWVSGGQVAAFTAARERVHARSAGLVTAHTVKFFADGVIESGTAAVLEPYCDAPHTCGMPVWAPAELRDAVTAFDAAGFQVHIHAIGDAGVRPALDAVEAAQAANPAWDRRPVIAHVQLVDPADLDRFAALGVVANFEPLWAQLDPLQRELTIPRLGPERAALQYPMGDLAARGVRLSFGSDWPVTSPVPMEGVAIAVTRRTDDGLPDEEGWTPHQKLTIDQALDAYTTGVAYQVFADDRGVLTPGAAADLVWLGHDPRAAVRDGDAGTLASISVRGTWLAGRAVHGTP